jgi:hypothetical protein
VSDGPFDPRPTAADEAHDPAGGTRSDGSSGASPSGDSAPPGGPTAPDPQPLPTGAATRSDAAAAPEDPQQSILDRLPPSLEHYRLVPPPLAEGGQARVYRGDDTRQPDGEPIVIKIYHHARPGIQDVWERWRATDETYVVPLIDGLTYGGRCYEITPFQQLGSLHHFRRSHFGHNGAIPLGVLEPVVGQLAEALHRLHTAQDGVRLVHRDVKPPNILVRTESPLQVRLTDFGIAVTQQQTYEDHKTRSRSSEYAAPETLAMAGVSTPYQDWWALGMTVAELTAGRHPLSLPDGSMPDPKIIENHVVRRPIPVDDGLDPRWQLLLRGLLLRDPDVRWGYNEVRDWLAGRPQTAPADEPVDDQTGEPGEEAPPFDFPAGRARRRPAELAAAIATHWREAAQTLVITPHRWGELRDWAAGQEPGLGRAVDEIFERQLQLGQPDRRVAELLVALDPGAAPVFRGAPADPAGLAAWARAAAAEPPDLAARDDIRLLFEQEALVVLAALHGQAGLRAVDRTWRQWCAAAEDAVRELHAELPEAPTPDTEAIRLLLLGAAADQQAARDLARAAARVTSRRNLRLDWVRRLAARANGPAAPAAHAVLVLVAPLAADPLYRNSAIQRERIRRFLGDELPAQAARLRSGSGRAGRRAWRATPFAGGIACYLALALLAGVGVGAGTAPLQGVLTGLVLLAAGAALYLGMRRPRHRLADALVTGWAGAVVGLVPAILLGGVAGLAAGPGAGWPAFWGTWVVAIMTGTTLGAVR